MKEIIVYNNHNANLSSIKSIEDNFSDKNYLSTIMENLYKLTGGTIYVHSIYDNYDLTTITSDISKNIDKISNLLHSNNFNEVSFECDTLDDTLDKLIKKMWFAYEQMILVFFSDNKEKFDGNKVSWEKVTLENNCFAMFKGMEEDVIWIGKSSNLTFPYPYSTIIG